MIVMDSLFYKWNQFMSPIPTKEDWLLLKKLVLSLKVELCVCVCVLIKHSFKS